MTPNEQLALILLVESLQASREYAITAGLDHHFVSDIDHLISTAEANREEESK